MTVGLKLNKIIVFEFKYWKFANTVLYNSALCDIAMTVKYYKNTIINTVNPVFKYEIERILGIYSRQNYTKLLFRDTTM